MNYPKISEITLFRLNNGNTLLGEYTGSDENYFEIINPALIMEEIDKDKNTVIDIVPAIQKHYVEEGTSLNGISWLLEKSVVVVLSNSTLKINKAILNSYNNLFKPVETNADSNARI